MADKPVPLGGRQFTLNKYDDALKYLEENPNAQHAFMFANEYGFVFYDRHHENEKRIQTKEMTYDVIEKLGLSQRDKSRVKEIIKEYKKV
tara:strand:+ start:988 stop:1257 length:270 start_codon:yes stop_codon:yes gene_type:complete